MIYTMVCKSETTAVESSQIMAQSELHTLVK